MSPVTAFSCPNCGASISMQAQGWSVTVACGTCGSVLDALDPTLRVLQRHAERLTVTPKIPLGTRGTINGRPYVVIGCQRVSITVEGVDYSWTEYVCFNPYHGFVYLSEYQGHWNVIEKLRSRPVEPGGPTALHDGRVFRQFQSAQARTTFALGEFPWELRVGDEVWARDFISPPYLLSAEGTAFETTWSLGRYTPPAEMARMFGIKALNARPTGVFANQPNPHLRNARRVRKLWSRLSLAWLAMLIGAFLLTARQEVLAERGEFVRANGEANAVVLGPFELTGRPANVRVDLRSDVSNDWVWFGLSLIDEESGQARDFSAQTSYYFGRDSDGDWSEGSQQDDVTVAEVPSGRYLLRVAPEGDASGAPRVNYEVRVIRDVPSMLLFGLAFGALFLPMALAWWPTIGFESRRWNESDHEGVVLSFPPEEVRP
jgi:hypothetical protein